jgi:hypothetical protein
MAKRESAYTQLLATTRRGGPGTINKARVELWRAIRAAAACLDGAMADGDDDRVLKACHAVAQLTSVYGRITSEYELERRLSELEKRLLDERPYTPNGATRNGGL